MDTSRIDSFYFTEIDDDIRIAAANALLNGLFELFDVGSFDPPFGQQDEDGPVAPLYGLDCHVVFRDRGCQSMKQ